MKLTPDKRERFLTTLTLGSSVTTAARAVGITTQSLYARRELDPLFAEAWAAAVEEGTDKLEDAALERALKHSDLLMIFLLKARRPEKYRDQHDINIRGTVTHEIRDLPAHELIRRLAELRSAQSGVEITGSVELPLIEGPE